MGILSDCPQLQFPIRRLFCEYLQFCFTIMLSSSQSGQSKTALAEFFTERASSDPPRVPLPAELRLSLEKIALQIREHSRTFTTVAEVELQARIYHQRQRIASKLATYPLIQLPDETTTSRETQLPIFMVEMVRDYRFLPRESTIASIKALFQTPTSNTCSRACTPTQTSQSDRSTACLVLHGSGGICKTQTALEYTHTMRNYYDVIFWVEAEHPSTLAAAYAKIADRLNLTEDNGKDTECQSQAIKRPQEWLRSTSE